MKTMQEQLADAWNEGARATDQWHQGGQLLSDLPENPYGGAAGGVSPPPQDNAADTEVVQMPLDEPCPNCTLIPDGSGDWQHSEGCPRIGAGEFQCGPPWLPLPFGEGAADQPQGEAAPPWCECEKPNCRNCEADR